MAGSFDLASVLFIAVGLSMDAMAVAITSAFARRDIRFRDGLLMAVCFGGFQALMLALGWFAGESVAGYISAIDHWIAFLLLALIGGRMIAGALFGKEEEVDAAMTISVLLMLAIATSIDSFAVGLSFAFLDTAILVPALIIGSVTFILSLGGFLVGHRYGALLGKRAELAGGIILILIGIRILIEHLVAG
jgi:putative Mn2+ efflux pump MntP